MIYVVGPMSSGCRLLRDVIEASGLTAQVDRSHGTADLPLDAQVIVIRRHRWFTDRSREAAWTGHPDHVPYAASIQGIRSRYPDAPVIWYRDLCDRTDETVRRLAATLCVVPWRVPFQLENQNQKWLTGGGPQIGAGAPGNMGRSA